MGITPQGLSCTTSNHMVRNLPNSFISISCAKYKAGDSKLPAEKWEKLPILLKSSSFPIQLVIIFFDGSYLECILPSCSLLCAWQPSWLASPEIVDCTWVSESMFPGLWKFLWADSAWLPWRLLEGVYASHDGNKWWPLFLSSETLQICPWKANLGIKRPLCFLGCSVNRQRRRKPLSINAKLKIGRPQQSSGKILKVEVRVIYKVGNWEGKKGSVEDFIYIVWVPEITFQCTQHH